RKERRVGIAVDLDSGVRRDSDSASVNGERRAGIGNRVVRVRCPQRVLMDGINAYGFAGISRQAPGKDVVEGQRAGGYLVGQDRIDVPKMLRVAVRRNGDRT